MFINRLKIYRENELGISTKKEMSEKMGVSEQLYAMVERGARKPSSDFLGKLVLMSNLPEEYWLYGVTSEKDVIDKRKEFKSLENTIIDLLDDGYIVDTNFSEEIEQIILSAARTDIHHLLLKRKNNKD